MNFITSDPTLAVGDYVFHNYGNNEFLWKITKIERRYLNQDDIKYYSDAYKGGKVGDEYNPLITIESVVNFSIKTDLKKKTRKQQKVFDAAYLIKVNPQMIDDHVQRLKQLITNLWG